MSKSDNKDDIMTSTLSIEITNFQDKVVDKKSVTFYELTIFNNYSKNKWTLEKRYSEFYDLYNNLAKLVNNCPVPPSKSFFKLKSMDELTKRKNQLDQFIKSCVVRKDIATSGIFRDFIEIEKNSPELTVSGPNQISCIHDLPLGVRDMVYSKQENLMFLVCSDMNISSRIDAYVTNFNFPWEKKTDAHITVGAVFSYKVKLNAEGAYEFDKLWAKSFPVQTGCLCWDSESSTLGVGLDDGRVIFYKTSPESNFTKYEECCELKSHTKRVMGIYFDSKCGYVYSCSSDKKFIISDFNSQKTITEAAVSPSGYTNLTCDKKNSRVFLTNETGVVYIFSIEKYPPLILTSVQTSSKNSIRALNVDYRKMYIFTGTADGKLGVLDLGLPGKERFLKEITSLDSGKRLIRVIRYCCGNNQVIAGDENGKVTIWNLRTGQPIYAFDPHSSAITQMYYEEESRLLVTAGKDRTVRFWRLPERWISEEVQNFEETEIKTQKDTAAMLKIQRQQSKREEDEDSEDDLNGWDFR